MTFFENPHDVFLDGLAGERWRANAAGVVAQKDESALLAGFRRRPGAQAWVGEHVGKWIDAARRVADLTWQPELETKLERVVRELLQTQAPDGYLGTYLPPEHWSGWDVWVHKYALLGLSAQARARHCGASLEGAEKIVQLLARRFAPAIDDLFSARVSTHCGMAAASVLGPLMHFHALAGDQTSIELAERIAAGMEQGGGPRIVSGLLEHGDVTRIANGKAYELLSCLLGLLKLHVFRPDEDQLRAAVRAVDDIIAHHRYPSGGSSHHEYYTHRRDWSAAGAVSETCVVVTWIEVCDALWQITGNQRYLDEIQRAWMNALLAAQRPDGMAFCYFTPLTGTKPYDAGITCCSSSGARGIAMAPRWFARLHGDTLEYLSCFEGHASWTTAHGKLRLQVRGDFLNGAEGVIEVERWGRDVNHLRVRKPDARCQLHDLETGQLVPGDSEGFAISFEQRERLRLGLRWKARDEVIPGAGQQAQATWHWRAPWLMCQTDAGAVVTFAAAGAHGERYCATWADAPPGTATAAPRAVAAWASGSGARNGVLDGGAADVLWSAAAPPGTELEFGLRFAHPVLVRAVHWRHAVPRWESFGFATGPEAARIEVQPEPHADWQEAAALPPQIVGWIPQLRVDPPHGRDYRIAIEATRCIAIRVVGTAPESGEIYCAGLVAEGED